MKYKRKTKQDNSPPRSSVLYSRGSKNNIRHCQRSFEIVSEATEDLQRTLQAFYEFRSHVNKMVTNMDVLEEHHQKKCKHPIVKTFQMTLFRANTKEKLWSWFALISVLVLLFCFIVYFHDKHLADL